MVLLEYLLCIGDEACSRIGTWDLAPTAVGFSSKEIMKVVPQAMQAQRRTRGARQGGLGRSQRVEEGRGGCMGVQGGLTGEKHCLATKSYRSSLCSSTTFKSEKLQNLDVLRS